MFDDNTVFNVLHKF